MGRSGWPGPSHGSPSWLLCRALTGPARARRRLRYLPGTTCHLVAILGLSVRGKHFFPQPTCNPAIYFLEKICMIDPSKPAEPLAQKQRV